MFADTFQIKGKVKNQSENMIQAEGYGQDYETAQKAAFSSAVQTFVGVIISQESYMENYVTIKDELLAVSNGYIEEYEVLEKNVDNEGVYYIKILAKVKQQTLYDKAKSMNLDVKKLDKKLLQNIYSRVTTKRSAKDEVDKMFRKKFNRLFSKKSIYETIEVKIANAVFLEKEERNNKIPLAIYYYLECNEDMYNQKVNEFREFINDLGFDCNENYDKFIPKMTWTTAGEGKLYKLSKTDFGIIQKKGESYFTDIWHFPQDWDDIYPFNITNENIPKPSINKCIKLILEIKNNENKIIYTEDITSFTLSDWHYFFLTHYTKDSKEYLVEWRANGKHASYENAKNIFMISPFFNIKDKCVKPKYKKIWINLSDVENITDITIRKVNL
jgi:hypothetical protein